MSVNLRKRVSGFCFLLLFLSVSERAFAWEPCRPFCDVNCGGRALQQLGLAVSSQLQGLATVCQELTLELANTSQAFSNLALAYGTTRVENQVSTVRALDALITRKMLSIDKNAAYLSSFADSFSTMFNQLVPDIVRVKQVQHHADTLGRAAALFSPIVFESAPCTDCAPDLMSQFATSLSQTTTRNQRLMHVILEDSQRKNTVRETKRDLEFVAQYQQSTDNPSLPDAENTMRFMAITTQALDRAQHPLTLLSLVLKGKDIGMAHSYQGLSFEQMLTLARQNSVVLSKDNQSLAMSSEHQVILNNLYQLQVKNASLMALVEQQERDFLLEMIGL